AAALEAIAARIDGAPITRLPNADTRCAVVIEAVMHACHIDPTVFWSRVRTDEVTVPRHIAAHALHCLLGLHLKSIARALHWGHHGSVIHALRQVRNRRDVDPVFAEKLSLAMTAAHAAVAQMEGLSA
ncbi:MAG TPA: helix-turn-helix domain-containing protein, partial [Opitutaceae bacterium]|nr:helix-turn-helix domain-containing protein [Opitutaceae bacterium]